MSLFRYDKLKPYRICIHGAIDGFSRSIVWLHAATSNNDPAVKASKIQYECTNQATTLGYLSVLSVRIKCTKKLSCVTAGYYLNAVRTRGGCPKRIRADAGTENRHIEQLQRFFRDETERCFMYGKSTANQRIEWFWGLLRKEVIQVFMNLFAKLKDDGDFCGDQLDKFLIQYCFMDVIQVNTLTI